MLKHKYIPLILSLILILSSINIVTAEENTPHTIYVSTEGNDTYDGLTPATSKRTIVNAVESAKDGDIIQLAPGNYVEKDIIIKKKLTLRGTDPKNTIIQGKGQKYASVIEIKYNGNVLVQKLTITRVKTKKKSRGIMNYGILTVEESIITGHKGSNGGGGIASQLGGILTVRNCKIINNTATYGGGGIGNYKGTVLVEDSIISNNAIKGSMGGGIDNGLGFCTIRRSVISGNEVYASFGMGYFRGVGGGLFNAGKMIIEDSVITGNLANYGGGYYGINQNDWNSNLVLENSNISNNRARIKGGGIYITKKGRLIVINSAITDNKPNNGYKGT